MTSVEPAHTEKRCAKCQITKPTTDFYRETKGSRGREGRFRAVCKDCWNGNEPPVTDDERKQFVERFVVDHIKINGETCDEFFRQWLSHKYPEISQNTVQRAINDLLEATVIKVSRFEVASLDRVDFLALV